MGHKCGNIKCDICNVFYLSIEFESTMTEKKYINFKFDCNSINVTYLVTCKICRKQYLGSNAKKLFAIYPKISQTLHCKLRDREDLNMRK